MATPCRKCTMVRPSLLKRCLFTIPKCAISNQYAYKASRNYFRVCNEGFRGVFSQTRLMSTSFSVTRCRLPHWSSRSLHISANSLQYKPFSSIADDVLKKKLEPSSGNKTESSNEAEDQEEKKKRDASWKAIKLTFYVLGIGGTSFFLWFVYTSGSPEYDVDGTILEDEFSHMPVVQQYFMRSWKEVKFYNKMIKDPSRDKLLPEPLTEPYYQPPYTLVLELKGILVHPEWTYSTGWRFKKRPAVEFFLQQVGPPLFEIVIYTSEQGFTAFPIIDALDPQGFVMYRLFKDATRYMNGVHVKDLNCLNRDLSKIIMVDWNEKSVQLNKPNSLILKRWEGNEEDRSLIELAIMLRTIATSGVGDVREVLHYYQQFEDPIAAFRENQRRAQEQQEEQLRHLQEQKEKGGSLSSGFTSRFFRR